VPWAISSDARPYPHQAWQAFPGHGLAPFGPLFRTLTDTGFRGMLGDVASTWWDFADPGRRFALAAMSPEFAVI